VAEQLVVGHRQRAEEEGLSGRVLARGVAEGHVDERLVERDPEPHPVAERLADQPGVVGEPERRVAAQPAAAVLQGLWQVPVEERDDGVDALGQQGVHKAVVEVDPGGVGRAGAIGLDAGPGHRETVRVDAEPGHQVDVVRVPVEVVARDVAGAAVGDPARLVGEGVPDGRSASTFGDAALDLVRRRRHTPGKGHARPPRTRKILAL
jgi:hypothetical protein